MPLVMAPVDTEMEVKKISADEKTKKHLRELGIAGKSQRSYCNSQGGQAVFRRRPRAENSCGVTDTKFLRLNLLGGIYDKVAKRFYRGRARYYR